MPDDTTVRPLSEKELEHYRQISRSGWLLSHEPWPAEDIRRLLATIAQRDALIEELRARVKELEEKR